MALGIFGNIRPADVDIQDIEIFYTYSPSRENVSNIVYKLDASEIITQLNEPESDEEFGYDNTLEGFYNLTLPADTFNQIGIYNIYIRPKRIKTAILDCGVLSSSPSTKGIVLDTTRPELVEILSKLNNENLTGYRIEYYDEFGVKQKNLYRIVTSANKCVAVNENLNNSSQSTTRYRFSDVGSLIYLTVTPSSANEIKPNTIPYIGTSGQKIQLVNTTFNPIMLEVEIVEYDETSLALGLFGDQTRDTKNGILTYYDEDGLIFKQFDENEPLYEVKIERESIDFSQNLDEITDLET